VLFDGGAAEAARSEAQALLTAALRPGTPDGTAERVLMAARQGNRGARGAFADTLDALVQLLHTRARQLAMAGEEAAARRTAASVLVVEAAQARAQGNVNPQLLSAHLMATLHRMLVP
jgi:hypothetical protein